MPSLSALWKFKTSLDEIGGQGANLAAAGIPFNDMVLPEGEPEPMPDLSIRETKESKETSENLDTDTPDTDEDEDEDIAEPATPGDEPKTPEPPPPPDLMDFDFSAFTGAQPADIPAAPESDPSPGPSETPPPDVSAEPEFNLPDNLLSDIPSDIPDEIPAEDIEDDIDFDIPDGFNLTDEGPSERESPGTQAEAAADDFDLGGLGDLDNLDLPEETAAGEAPAEEATENFDIGDLGDLDNLDLPEETAAGEAPAEGATEDFDIGDLGDLDLPEETAGGEVPAESATEDFDIGDLGDLDLPDETAGGEVPAEAATEDLDLGDLGDLSLPDETAGGEAPAEEAAEDLDLGDLGDLSLPDEATGGEAPAEEAAENFDIGDLGDLDLPEETAAGEAPAEGTADDFDLGDLGGLDDLDVPDETFSSPDGEPAAMPAAADTPAPDLGGLEEFDTAADTPAEDGGFDLFDSFDPTKKATPTGKKPAKASGDTDSFDFPDLDNVLDGRPAARKTEAVPSGKAKGRGWTNPNASLEELEEIQLTDTELDSLQQTLSGYPLNLRLACEEIIAEQVVNPVQMAQLLRLLVRGAHPRATASLAGDILGRSITVPKSFEKKTGAALEAEQGTFAYIFVHNLLPILRLFLFIAVVAGCLFFLIYTFVYKPLKADSIYKLGIERIADGEYQRANERFNEASKIHRKKVWYYRYAEAFRDARQYVYAEEKYDELLRYYPRDKKGVLDYAFMETYYLRNYSKADDLLRHQLLDYNPDDYDGLLAAGDNNLAWGEVEPERYEDARYNYARLLEKYGWKPPIVERMMLYFIRTDNLKEVLPLRRWFEKDPKKRRLSPETTAELGGYLLDKQLEEPEGVPNEYVPYIESVRAMLLKAAGEKPSLPEAHYHLARYYHNFGNRHEERVTLETAIRAFENAQEESVRRIIYHIDALRRLADVLINDKEFIPAEEQLIKAINLYQDALSRFRDPRSREAIARYQFGNLYASLGDLEYFVKSGDMQAAIRYYRQAEDNGWAPPEMLYRLGAAYYQLENWKDAQEKIFAASKTLPFNDRILFALGNVSFKRGDYFAAQGYYSRLLDRLESRRSRLPILLPNDRPEYLELAERLLMAQNNTGAAYEMLAAQTGDQSYRNQAMALYSRSEMSWDSRTRDPRTMVRSGSTPLPFINMRNMLRPQGDYEPQIFIRIDRDAVEPSLWEELAPVAPDRY